MTSNKHPAMIVSSRYDALIHFFTELNKFFTKFDFAFLVPTIGKIFGITSVDTISVVLKVIVYEWKF